MVPSTPGSRNAQGLHGLAKPRATMVSPNSWSRNAQGLHGFAKRRASLLSHNSGSQWSRQAQGLHGFTNLRVCPTLRVSMVTPNSGSPLFHHTQGLPGLTKLRVSIGSDHRSETVNTDVRVCSFNCLPRGAHRRVAHTQHVANASIVRFLCRKVPPSLRRMILSADFFGHIADKCQRTCSLCAQLSIQRAEGSVTRGEARALSCTGFTAGAR